MKRMKTTNEGVPTPKRPRGDKVGDAELTRRIAMVSGLLLDGHPRRHVVTSCDREFGVSLKTAERYIAAATEDIAASYKPVLAAETAKLMHQFQTLARLSIEVGNFATANAVYGQIVKMLGLEKQQVEVKHSLDNPMAIILREVRDGREVTA